MANDIDLVTLDEAKSAVSAIGKASEMSADASAILEDVITRASKWFNDQTGRKLTRTAYSNLRVVGNARQLMVLEWPIVPDEDIVITVDGQTQTVWTPDSSDDPLDFDVEIRDYPLQGWKDFYRRVGWPKLRSTIRVSYTAGYLLNANDSDNPFDTPVPGLLREGVLALVRDMWRLTDRQMTGISSMSINGQSTAFDSLDVPKRVKEIADMFSRVEMLVSL